MMKPEPIERRMPWCGGGIGPKKRRKISGTSCSSKSGTWLSVLPVACTLTTAGPYLSTSWVKSGSSAAATVALDATANNTATNQRERGCVMKSLLVVESEPACLASLDDEGWQYNREATPSTRPMRR